MSVYGHLDSGEQMVKPAFTKRPVFYFPENIISMNNNIVGKRICHLSTIKRYMVRQNTAQ